MVGCFHEQDKIKISLLVILLFPSRSHFIMPFLTLNGLFSASSVRSDMMAYRVSARRDDAYKKGKVKYMPVDVMGRVIYCVDRFGKYDLEYVEDMIQGECHIGSYFCVFPGRVVWMGLMIAFLVFLHHRHHLETICGSIFT